MNLFHNLMRLSSLTALFDHGSSLLSNLISIDLKGILRILFLTGYRKQNLMIRGLSLQLQSVDRIL